MSSPSQPPTPDQPKKLKTADLGTWGEKLVLQWLQQQQWTILAHQWRCRRGEIDIIAQSLVTVGKAPKDPGILAFVEVKTRSPRNWDADGRLAITPQKQRKLWTTAQVFLGKHPHLAELPCRFDVALVQHRTIKPTQVSTTAHPHNLFPIPETINLGIPVQFESHQLMLSDYVESAFTL